MARKLSKAQKRKAMQAVPSNGEFHVIPSNGGWAVKREGTAKASKIYDSRGNAIHAARDRAERSRTTVVVHGRDGTVRRTYAGDPRPPNEAS